MTNPGRPLFMVGDAVECNADLADSRGLSYLSDIVCILVNLGGRSQCETSRTSPTSKAADQQNHPWILYAVPSHVSKRRCTCPVLRGLVLGAVFLRKLEKLPK